MKKANILHVLTALLITAITVSGCKGFNKAQKGVLIGAGAGDAVGAGVGKAAGNTVLGTIIGAAVGGVTGGIIGRQMDKEAKEIAQIPGAEVKRVGEGINVTFAAGLLFPVDKASLTPEAQSKVKELSTILNKYPDTYVLIEGHTDATGTIDYNKSLSDKRAKAVADYLKEQNIQASRLKTASYGESQPKESNETEAGKAANRRVEFAIYATEKLIEKAKTEKAS